MNEAGFVRAEMVPKSRIALKKKKWCQLRKAHTNKQRKVNMGIWRLKETISYIDYLEDNFIILGQLCNGQKSSIYRSMSTFIKTRTALQCRSHHQKMIKTHNSLSEIISYYRNTVIPFFLAEERRLKFEQVLKKFKKSVPFYKLFVCNNVIRIEIEEKKIEAY